jgi:hypothetical protein
MNEEPIPRIRRSTTLHVKENTRGIVFSRSLPEIGKEKIIL